MQGFVLVPWPCRTCVLRAGMHARHQALPSMQPVRLVSRPQPGSLDADGQNRSHQLRANRQRGQQWGAGCVCPTVCRSATASTHHGARCVAALRVQRLCCRPCPPDAGTNDAALHWHRSRPDAPGKHLPADRCWLPVRPSCAGLAGILSRHWGASRGGHPSGLCRTTTKGLTLGERLGSERQTGLRGRRSCVVQRANPWAAGC